MLTKERFLLTKERFTYTDNLEYFIFIFID